MPPPPTSWTYTILVTFQFPFRRDGLCMAGLARIGWVYQNELSVPFSSGWPLHGAAMRKRHYKLNPFQFPFRRDGLCMENFYFHYSRVVQLSVPFSSGWPLHGNRRSNWLRSCLLSVPFSSGWPLHVVFCSPEKLKRNIFQFPFRRDGLCMQISDPFKASRALYTFSSLFVGMASA